MSNYKVFAVAGLGRIGINIARELLSIQKGDHGRIEAVHLLTQSASKLSNEIRAELIGEGAHLHTVNYTSPTSVSDALQGVDVLISAIGYRGLSSQEALCDRAKEARVKLFVPSEYGARSDDMKDPLFAIKELFRQKLIANGIKFAAFYSGFWADFDLDPNILRTWFDINFEAGSVAKWTNWDVPLSFTTQKDVARYVTHILVYLPREKLEDKIFRFEADRQTWESLFSAFLSLTRRPNLSEMKLKKYTRRDLDERLEMSPTSIGLRLMRAGEDGKFCVTVDGQKLDNDLWPEWKPEKPLDVMLRLFAVERNSL